MFQRRSLSSGVLLLAVLSIVGTSLFVGGVAADSPLQEMDGEGTEDDPYVITTVEELQAMENDPSAHYVLGNDVDASETAEWNARSGFEPVGDFDAPFTGTFDGQGHTIDGLTVNRPDSYMIGLFGRSDGTIRDVHLEDAEIAGKDYVGTLTGVNRGEIRSVTAEGEVSGHEDVGGLVGNDRGDESVITDAVADVDVEAESRAGGLVAQSHADVSRSASHGDVTSDDFLGGGLVGANYGTVSDSYATGDVEAKIRAGGLVGVHIEGAVRTSYATGDTTAGDEAGGLVGIAEAPIQSSFATGTVHSDTSIDDTYVDAPIEGGLVGELDEARLADSYWDVETSGRSAGVGEGEEAGTGLTSAELGGTAAETNAGAFDTERVWAFTDEHPVLQWQVEAVDLSADDAVIAEGDSTDATVTLTLDDGSTITASETAEYDADTSVVSASDGTLSGESVGETEVTATVLDYSDTATVEVREPPQIGVTDAALESAGVVNGSTARVDATLENTGGMAGSYDAELVVDGETVDGTGVKVDAGEEKTATLEWTPGAVGSYDLAVDDADAGSLTVVESGTVSLEALEAPAEIGAGDEYDLELDLENAADVPVAETVEYRVDGDRRLTETVVADPGESTATVSHAVDDLGEIEHEAVVGGTAANATSDVREPARFLVTGLEVPDDVEAGDEIDVSATIENDGSVADTRTVSFFLGDGDEVGSEELTLESGASGTASATIPAETDGELEIGVETVDDGRVESVTVAAADDGTGDGDGAGETETGVGTDGGADETDDESDGLPGFGAVGALAALLAVGAARVRSSRPGSG